MSRWLKSALVGVVLACGALFPALAGPEVRVADNVFVVPDPKAKVITLWMIVNAGCRDEEGGQCRGLAHYLEHLLFIGRKGDHEGAAPSVFASGQTNAFTTMIATAYYQTTPVREGAVAEDVDKLFALYAQRLGAIDIPEDAAVREVNVVRQEYNSRRSGSVRSNFYTQMNRKLQPDHPASQSIIGTTADIDAFSLERAKAFHARWYARNNVTFVLYGPVAPDDVKAVAAKHIDPLPRKKIPQRGWLDARRTFESMDETMRVEDPETKRTEVYLQKIVRFEDADPTATAAANSILFDYVNSQIKGSLSDVFVENKKMATSAHISSTALGAGVMWYTLSATLEEGTTPEAMKAAFTDYMNDLAKTGIDASVVNRLKRRRVTDIAEVEKEPQRVFSALQGWISGNRTYADWQTRSETFNAVTPQMMQSVLQAMTGPGRQIFGVLAPKR